MLAIAHRLDTIMDYDQVLVMDGGKAVEKGEPAKLLRDKKSHLYKLAAATGKDTLQALKAQAERRYQ